MEAFSKVLELLSRSIKSLRWWALATILIGMYLKYAPAHYLVFVDRDFLMRDDRSQWLGLLVLLAFVIFGLGWIATGVDALTVQYRQKVRQNWARKQVLEQQHIALKRRRRERRLLQLREDQVLQDLTENQGAMVKDFLAARDGILKITNDASLDIATLLVSKQIVRRIRPWYDSHGHTIGEVFVIQDWVRRQALRHVKAQGRAEQAMRPPE